MIINISGDYAGKPMQDSGVYALMERLQKKTGIKSNTTYAAALFCKLLAGRLDGSWNLSVKRLGIEI